MCLIMFTLFFIIWVLQLGCNARKLVTVKVTVTVKATRVCGTDIPGLLATSGFKNKLVMPACTNNK